VNQNLCKLYLALFQEHLVNNYFLMLC